MGGIDTSMLEAKRATQSIPNSSSNLSLASMVSDVPSDSEEDEREATQEVKDREEHELCNTQLHNLLQNSDQAEAKLDGSASADQIHEITGPTVHWEELREEAE